MRSTTLKPSAWCPVWLRAFSISASVSSSAGPGVRHRHVHRATFHALRPHPNLAMRGSVGQIDHDRGNPWRTSPRRISASASSGFS